MTYGISKLSEFHLVFNYTIRIRLLLGGNNDPRVQKWGSARSPQFWGLRSLRDSPYRKQAENQHNDEEMIEAGSAGNCEITQEENASDTTGERGTTPTSGWGRMQYNKDGMTVETTTRRGVEHIPANAEIAENVLTSCIPTVALRLL